MRIKANRKLRAARSFFEKALSKYQKKKYPLKILKRSDFLISFFICDSNCFCHSVEHMDLTNLFSQNGSPNLEVTLSQGWCQKRKRTNTLPWISVGFYMGMRL